MAAYLVAAGIVAVVTSGLVVWLGVTNALVVMLVVAALTTLAWFFEGRG